MTMPYCTPSISIIASPAVSAGGILRRVGRVGQQHSAETLEHEEIAHFEAVHGADYQGGSVVQFPGVDGLGKWLVPDDVPENGVDKMA